MAKESISNNANRTIAENRKARFNYQIEDSLECGIELKGTEVKSIKIGKISFTDSFVLIEKGELWLQGVHITPYLFGNINNHDPDRKKKLLVHKKEIIKLKRRMEEKGYALIPLKFYLKAGKVKCLLGIGKGKKLYDKREAIKNREVARDLDRCKR